jgi:cAMP-dependent protein kinase regulator
MSRGVPKEHDIKQYLINKDVQPLFISLMEALVIDMPHDVPSYLVQYLEKNFPIKRTGAKLATVPEQMSEPKPTSKPQKKQENKPFSAFSFGQKAETTRGTFASTALLTNIEDEDEDKDDEAVDDEEQDEAVDDSDDEDEDEEKPKANDLLEDKESDMIRRRYSVSVPRRVGISNESLKVDSTVKFPIIPKTEQERVRLQNAIDVCAVFKHLDKDEKQVVFDAMSEKTFSHGDVIIKQGDDGDLFYVVDSGQCDVQVNDKIVKTYTDGDSFGELALIYGTPRAATIKVKSDSIKLWAIDRTTFRTILMGQTIKRRQLYEDFLRNVEILKTLDDYERLTIADALQPETWHNGDCIVKQGDSGDSFYIISEGQVSVKKDGTEVARLKTADYFGELALMFNQSRAATVTALGEVKTVRLDRKSFKLLLGSCEEILKRNTNIYNQFMSKQI